MNKYAQIILIGTLSLAWIACGDKNGQASKPLTPAEVQAKKTEFDENLNKVIPTKTNTKGTEKEENAWEKSFEEQKKAEQTNFIGAIGDAGPEVKTSDVKIPDLTKLPLQEAPQSSDLSPITIIKNLLCKKADQCLPALDPAIEQAVGYYHFRADLGFGGKLINGVQMPLQGTGFLVKGNSQNVRWSTDHTIRFIETIAQIAAIMNLAPTLVVGDVSTMGGGFNTGHASHQNGLDVDVGLLGTKTYQLPTNHFPKDMVVNEQVTSNFGLDESWKLVNVALQTNWTVFVIAHPAIKQKFCDLVKTNNEMEKYRLVLSHIIPDKSHFDHFHFRLKCPISSPACVPADLDLQDAGCN